MRMIMLLFYPQISAPTTAQYRTVPWRPYNVTFNEGAIGPNFFEVRWSGPREITEFDRYQVSDAKKSNYSRKCISVFWPNRIT